MNSSRRAGMRGFSLIELLVSMAIALVVTLAITTVMIQGEGSKRSTTSVNEVNQTGAYVTYLLDRQLRSAGSGFAQRWADSFGCSINAVKDGTAVLPLAAAIDPPFEKAPLTLPLAPVLIQAGAADTTGAGAEVRGDLITTLAGTSGFSEMPAVLSPTTNLSVANPTLLVPSSLGYASGDLVLLADSSVAGGCLIEQLGTVSAGALPTSGDYYTATGSTVALSNFGGNTYVIQLGNMPNNPPRFLTYGVGGNHTLFSYDLLKTGSTEAPTPIADSVVEMRAIYGLDTTNPPDGTVDTWVLPEGQFGISSTSLPVTDALNVVSVATARLRLRQIVAVRIGFILRTSLKEKERIATGTDLVLFGDLDPSVRRTRTIAGDDEYYRFRTIEVTVPLRNVLLSPASP